MTAADAVLIRPWAIAVIASFLLAAGGWVYSAGMIASRLTAVEAKLELVFARQNVNLDRLSRQDEKQIELERRMHTLENVEARRRRLADPYSSSADQGQ